ncbi:MAG: exodeoxyribonuclease VII small subunit [Coprococcus sp.]
MSEKKDNDFSIEESIERLEEIAQILENPDTTLKESLAVYTEGAELIEACKKNLCDVEKEMIILTEKGENIDRG